MSWNAEIGGWWLICSKKISEPSDSVACHAYVLIKAAHLYFELALSEQHQICMRTHDTSVHQAPSKVSHKSIHTIKA